MNAILHPEHLHPEHLHPEQVDVPTGPYPGFPPVRRPRHAAVRPPVPAPGCEVPPGVAVPSFPPIRAGCTVGDRLPRAVRRRPLAVAAVMLAATAALGLGPWHGAMAGPAAGAADRQCAGGAPP